MPSDAAAIRAFAGRALVAGLCIAAAAAVLALLTGSFDDTDLNVIATSLGFAAASATGATGAAARLRPSESLRVVGGATVVASVVAFVLLVGGLWTDMGRYGDEDIWRAFGCVGVLAIAGAHSCLLLGARRERDTELIRTITAAAVALALVDTTAALLPLLELVDDIGEGWARLLGSTLVLLVLTSVLPPILRRMQPAATAVPDTNGKPDPAPDFFATAVIQSVDRLELLNADPGNRSPEIGAELRRLKSLARGFEN